MRGILILITGIFLCSYSHAQTTDRKPLYSREIGMIAENDIVFLVDYYYTAGQDFYYRRLAQPHSRMVRLMGKTDSSKVIIQYNGGLKIFTPRNIDYSDTKTMDRPYAGWSSGSISVMNFPQHAIANKYEVEVGLVGKFSGVGQLQRWVHHVTKFEQPHGWNSQIRDEVVINMYYSRLNELKIASTIDVVLQSAVQAGNGGNKLSQDITFRFLQFNPINNSAFTQSRLSWDTRQQGKFRKHEFFLFAGAGVDYVISNIFIQGSLFKDNRSVFSVPIQPWILRRDIGVMYSNHIISWNITWYHLSKEVKQGINHDYGSIAMAVRF